MKIAFFSNFLNHHQLSFCQELISKKDIEFIFVATEKIPESRSKMKYEDMNCYPFVLRAYESEEAKSIAVRIANEYDIVIWGAAPSSYIIDRIQDNKITLRFCERLFKKGTWRRFLPNTRKKIYSSYIKFKGKNLFILGASSYAAGDFELCGFPLDKCFKWGYFPYIEEKKIEEIFALKNKNKNPEILYVGRLLPLKHVMDTVKAVYRLNKQEVKLHFTIIGDGESRIQIEKFIKKHKLENIITILPFMSPQKVREYMDKSDIFVFSSNFYEGWGAVVNEAMNSACAVVVSHAVGSAKYLIDDEKNGCVYQYANINKLTETIKKLVLDEEKRRLLGVQAYETVYSEWSPEVAAERLICFCQAIQEGNKNLSIYTTGPLSPAKQ